MKKSLKKIAAFSLAGLMTISSFSFGVSAAPLTNTEKIAKVIDLGVILGEGNGVNLEQNMTRYRAFTMLVRLAGKQSELDNFTYDSNSPTFADADVEGTSPFVKQLMAYLKANEAEFGIVGYEDGTLRPYEEISSKEYARVLLEALGYRAGVDYDWNTVNLLSYALGLVNSATDLNDDVVNVANIAVLTYETLASNPKNGAKSLGEKLGFPVVSTVVQLVANSVNITNYKEINVTFNTAVNETLAKNLANFEVKVGSTVKTVEKAEVNNNVVTLTLAAGHELNVQDNVSVTVNKNLGLAENAVLTVNNVIDYSRPEVVNVSLAGPNSFTITFSEPLKENVNPVVLVNNGAYGASVTGVNGRVVTVSLPGTLEEGNYDITIQGATDYAGLVMANTTKTLAYQKVTAPVTAKVVSASQNEVVIEFSQKLQNPDATILATDFYYAYTSFNPNSVEFSADGRTATLKFDTHMIPEGNWTIVVRHNNIVSEWGNKAAANITLPISVKVDTTAPTVALDEVVAENKIVLVFDKEVSTASAENAANYTVRNSNNELVSTGFTATYADKKVTLTFAENLAGGNYTVVAKDVVDTTPQANKLAEKTLTFTITDKTAPHATDAKIVAAENIIYVTFNEAMNASALDTNNYRYQGHKPSAVAFFGSNNRVKLTFNTDITFTGSANLLIGQVADAAGNKIEALQTEVAVAELSVVEIASAKSISANQVVVVIDGKIVEGIAADNFIFTNADGSTTASAAYVSFTYNDKGQTVVTAVMKSGVSFAANEAPSSIEIVGGNLKADTGVNVTTDAFTSAVDGIAPTLNKADSSATTANVTLVFSEDLDTTFATLISTELNVSYKGNKLVAGIDYSTSVVDNTIVVTFTKALEAGNKVTVSGSSLRFIKDAENNIATDFSVDFNL